MKLSQDGEDAAIKKVLQDKRFKVLSFFFHLFDGGLTLRLESRIRDYEADEPPQCMWFESLFLFSRRRREGEFAQVVLNNQQNLSKVLFFSFLLLPILR